MGGPGWLYGQARNWATRDSSHSPAAQLGQSKPGAPAAGRSEPWAAGAAKAAGAVGRRASPSLRWPTGRVGRRVALAARPDRLVAHPARHGPGRHRLDFA